MILIYGVQYDTDTDDGKNNTIILMVLPLPCVYCDLFFLSKADNGGSREKKAEPYRTTPKLANKTIRANSGLRATPHTVYHSTNSSPEGTTVSAHPAPQVSPHM